jgi:Tfp pilus assembly protein PilO
MDDSNGWDTYSKLVLQQLETLSSGIEGLRGELQHVKEQLTELKAREDRVQDLKAWKERVEEVASPPQMKEALEDIEELKEFKTKAVTMFMVVQTIMGIALALALDIF